VILDGGLHVVALYPEFFFDWSCFGAPRGRKSRRDNGWLRGKRRERERERWTERRKVIQVDVYIKQFDTRIKLFLGLCYFFIHLDYYP